LIEVLRCGGDGGMTGRLIVAITGASGAVYGLRLLELARERFAEVYVCVSQQGRRVMAAETETDPASLAHCDGSCSVRLLDPNDMLTPPASGSFRHDGMVIVPCSMGTAGRIASGVSDDLITRAADVCLKERRPLVLVVRETPLNLIHLRNLTTLAEAGAIVLPACPAFYHRPETIADVVDTVVERAMQHLGAGLPSAREWQVDRT